ncbi:serine acetyltransferase 1, chloroplastic-like [Nymphaea colorata]|uniref:serine O-acetyltransferase n=1 Tax=Nymphaea colorata TaxID=210225 RepID=A0A5K1FLC6_9MAGN|nr:serine acetyltransferase 1, chloroplastic-like [Nymphaea colorata]
MAPCVEDSGSAMVAQRFANNANQDLISDPTAIYKFELLRALQRANDIEETDDLWIKMREEARQDVEQEPLLGSFYMAAILSHGSLESALATHLGNKLSTLYLPVSSLAEVFCTKFLEDGAIRTAVREDLKAIKERDPAWVSYVQCLLNLKGFLAIQAHRVAHRLWNQGRVPLALIIQNRVSEVFAVDIHPAARIGQGVLLDHATGVVIGETAVIGDNVSILHSVTLGGTGKDTGDRHPKIADGVLIGAGSYVLGNVKVGSGAKIGAGSVVLKEIPARTTAVGNPARLVGGKDNPIKSTCIPSMTMDLTSYISHWIEYEI